MSKNTIAFDVIFCIVRVDLLLNQLSMSTQQPLLTADTSAPLFTENAIRRQWHNDERYFSVVDVVAVLTNSFNPTDYLKKLRKRDEELAIYLGTNCPQVEMLT
jgi:hypothetical protein